MVGNVLVRSLRIALSACTQMLAIPVHFLFHYDEFSAHLFDWSSVLVGNRGGALRRRWVTPKGLKVYIVLSLACL